MGGEQQALTALIAECSDMGNFMFSVFPRFCRKFIIKSRQGLRLFGHNKRYLWTNYFINK